MSCQERLYEWRAEVAAHLPHLRWPEATVLALWSLGMVLTRSCGLTAVATVLAAGLGLKENSLRQQLREWCYDAADKRGATRRELAVEGRFAPVAGLGAEPVGGHALLVPAVSVLYRGGAIPVALESGPPG